MKLPAPFVIQGIITTEADGTYSGTLSDIRGDAGADELYGYLLEFEILGSASGTSDMDLTLKRDLTGAGTAFGSDLLSGQGTALALNSATVGVSLALSSPRLLVGEELYLDMAEQAGAGAHSYLVRFYCDGKGMRE